MRIRYGYDSLPPPSQTPPVHIARSISPVELRAHVLVAVHRRRDLARPCTPSSTHVDAPSCSPLHFCIRIVHRPHCSLQVQTALAVNCRQHLPPALAARRSPIQRPNPLPDYTELGSVHSLLSTCVATYHLRRLHRPLSRCVAKPAFPDSLHNPRPSSAHIFARARPIALHRLHARVVCACTMAIWKAPDVL